MKTIFNLIITQLEGLKNTKTKGEKGISYEKLFNLLEVYLDYNSTEFRMNTAKSIRFHQNFRPFPK